jgi:hydrogenase 3 maturation protease
MRKDTTRELQTWFEGAKKVVVAGIGNPNRSDDYVGLKIVEDLHGKVRKDVCLLECETVPESFLLEIEDYNPTHVLIIDAAILRHEAGEVCLVDLAEVPSFSAVSSHALPLRLFCEYINKSTKARIKLLLIEPESLEFAEGLTKKVSAISQEVTHILARLLG